MQSSKHCGATVLARTRFDRLPTVGRNRPRRSDLRSSEPPPAPPVNADATRLFVAAWRRSQRCHVVSSTPTTTVDLVRCAVRLCPPSINYGSSLLGLRPSELSLPEVFSTHRTLAAPAPPLHVFKSTIVISAASLPLCPSVSSFRIFRLRATCPRPQTPRVASIRAYPAHFACCDSHCPQMPFGSQSTSTTTFLATSRPRLSIGGATSPPSRRRTTNRSLQAGDIVHHAILPTRTRSTRHRTYPLATPLLRRPTPPNIPVHYPARHSTWAPRTPRHDMQRLLHAQPAPRPLFTVGAGLFASPRRLSRTPRATSAHAAIVRDRHSSTANQAIINWNPRDLFPAEDIGPVPDNGGAARGAFECVNGGLPWI
ncbi:hypothetical protein DFH09DRAFT_1360909 [Mycena vulgaris]|nr:hypothetical protein DFH09DRAFT_1360909 [Mycena vulgaris]